MEIERDKQKEIYEFLKTYTENKGYPPSVREICEAVSLSSTSTVHGHLKRLQKKGMIKRDTSKPRALEIAELSSPKKEMINIPIVSRIVNKNLILSSENIEDTFPLPLDYIRHDKELFMIKVHDESMINVGIRSNDLAIIEMAEEAMNGEIVLTLINNATIIRRFFKEKGYIRLQSENDNITPILIKECKIYGKLVGVFRSFA